MKLRKLTFFLPILIIIISSGVFAREPKDDALHYRSLGFMAQQQGHWDIALFYYSEARKVDPTWPVIYNDLGIIYEEKNMLELAEDMYLKALQLDEYYPCPYTNLALLYEKKLDTNKANLYWQKRILLGPPYARWVKIARRRLKGKYSRLSIRRKPIIDSRERALMLELDILPKFEQEITNSKVVSSEDYRMFISQLENIIEKNPCDDSIKQFLQYKVDSEIKNRIRYHFIRYNSYCENRFNSSAKEELLLIKDFISREIR